MERLVFIDDDEEELEGFASLVAGEFDYVPLHWPRQKPSEATVGDAPALFVSDLYLPSSDHVEQVVDFSVAMLGAQSAMAEKVGTCFRNLFPGPRHAKRRLRETMKCRLQGRQLLDLQWQGLHQSPEYGLELFRAIKNHPRYGAVPFIFYSRKITPEDVVAVLSAGATAAIRKQDW